MSLIYLRNFLQSESEGEYNKYRLPNCGWSRHGVMCYTRTVFRRFINVKPELKDRYYIKWFIDGFTFAPNYTCCAVEPRDLRISRILGN